MKLNRTREVPEDQGYKCSLSQQTNKSRVSWKGSLGERGWGKKK